MHQIPNWAALILLLGLMSVITIFTAGVISLVTDTIEFYKSRKQVKALIAACPVVVMTFFIAVWIFILLERLLTSR
jgi:diacylglycerol kinase